MQFWSVLAISKAAKIFVSKDYLKLSIEKFEKFELFSIHSLDFVCKYVLLGVILTLPKVGRVKMIDQCRTTQYHPDFKNNDQVIIVALYGVRFCLWLSFYESVHCLTFSFRFPLFLPSIDLFSLKGTVPSLIVGGQWI